MRIQILPLPAVVVGDVVDEPFALVVDQCQYDNLNLIPSSVAKAAVERWERFGEECFAAAVLVTDETVEIVDRYAEPKPEPGEPVPGEREALRDLHRLAEYVHDHFPDEAAKGGGTVVDVAMRLLGQELIRRDVVETRIRFDFPEPFDADKVAELLNRRDVGKRRTTEPMGYTIIEGVPGNAWLREEELESREEAIARWGSLVPLHGEGPFTVCKVVPLDEQEQR